MNLKQKHAKNSFQQNTEVTNTKTVSPVNTDGKTAVQQTTLRTDITKELHQLNINKADIIPMLKKDLLASCEQIAQQFELILPSVLTIAEQRFISMENVPVWYDRDQTLLFSNTMYGFHSNRSQTTDNVKKINKKFSGFTFRIPNKREVLKAFSINIKNPVANKGTNYIDFKGGSYDSILYDDEDYTDYLVVDRNGSGDLISTYSAENTLLILVADLINDGPKKLTSVESFKLWLENCLIPKGLTTEEKNIYEFFAVHYDILNRYIKLNAAGVLQFDFKAMYNDVLAQRFTEELVFNGQTVNFNFEKLYNDIIQNKVSINDFNYFKDNLLECDFKRANLSPYTENRIEDLNLGHWELFEQDSSADTVKINVPKGEHFIARPPQMDVVKNGVCGIDFGTKSTVVACFENESRLLRIGEGDYTKVPELKDYENPTVIELRDLTSFLEKYKARIGRPFTEWEQITVSHQAAAAITKENDNAGYYSVFSELKQWAIDKNRRLMLCDKQGKSLEIKPYLELQDNDLDPIELYAYYLGLYINNMNNGIYLHYVLSFPVNYELAVRTKLLKSFERGLKKALPPALLKDESVMKNFKIYAGASEPAAYAISALQEFKLQPKKPGEKICYGVFDFGGGTTDFDFGIEEIPEDERSKYTITQFGSGGDVYLGGENILLLLAYEVYKDNIAAMRKEQIPFVLPPKGERFSGSERLIYDRGRGSQQAYLNSRRLAEALRDIWERKGEYKEKYTSGSYAQKFLTNDDRVIEVMLKINLDKLEDIIKTQIENGVVNFFTTFKNTFKDKTLSLPVHIFLAGNSSKSPVVKELFEKYIISEEEKLKQNILKSSGESKKTDKCFVLHLPLGMEDNNKVDAAKENANTDNARPNRLSTVVAMQKDKEKQLASLDLDKIHTGKTGVVFGLLRSRKGARDVKIINRNNDVNNEVRFRYLLGKSDRENMFKAVIGWGVGYNVWAEFTFADEEDFELYYTSEPKGVKPGQLDAAKAKRLVCSIDSSDVSEDGKIFIRKIAPDKIQYTVANTAEDLNKFDEKTWQHTLYTVAFDE